LFQEGHNNGRPTGAKDRTAAVQVGNREMVTEIGHVRGAESRKDGTSAAVVQGSTVPVQAQEKVNHKGTGVSHHAGGWTHNAIHVRKSTFR